jgi:hypothetical protein
LLFYFFHCPLPISDKQTGSRSFPKQNASWTKHIPFRKVDIRDTYIHFLSSSFHLPTVFAYTKLTKRYLGSSQDSRKHTSAYTSAVVSLDKRSNSLQGMAYYNKSQVTRTSRGNADKISCIHCGATATSALHLVFTFEVWKDLCVHLVSLYWSQRTSYKISHLVASIANYNDTSYND